MIKKITKKLSIKFKILLQKRKESSMKLILDKKSHTCEEGGCTPQNFFLAFIYELRKQLLKNC